jgi:hypothetical protein
MAGENRTTAARMHAARERAIAALQEHFAQDDLDVEEFERRVTEAHTAQSPEALTALTHDLTPLESEPAGAPSGTTALIPAADVHASQTIHGMMSATTRSGAWSVPRRMDVKATMSAVVLDFRDARFPAGPVDVHVRALMSSVEIVVPPGLSVETHGSAIMGTFEEINRAPTNPDPDAPLLRIHGRAFMSAVDIQMRLPGESAGQTHYRQRRELREQRKAQRSLDRQK